MSRSICIPLVFAAAGASILVLADSGLRVCAKTSSVVPKELLQSRLGAARKVYELNLQKLQAGEAALDTGFLSWSQRWLDAELALSDNRADRVVALRAHLGRAKELEKIATTHMKAGQGRELDTQAATYFRIDAEIQLLQVTSE